MVGLANEKQRPNLHYDLIDPATGINYGRPGVTLWKNTASEGEGYVTGLEPGTNFPNNRRIERKLGRVPKLAPGASYSATIDYAIHIGTAQVKRVADRISAIKGKQKPVIARQPEKND